MSFRTVLITQKSKLSYKDNFLVIIHNGATFGVFVGAIIGE